MKGHERFRQLMMGAIDHELDSAEKHEFKRLLDENPEFQKEYDEFKRLKEVTLSMKYKNPPSEVWDKYWLHVYNRIERGLAWVVLSIGAIILLIYAIFELINHLLYDSDIQGFVKIGALFFIAGIIILFVSVIREKLHIFKTDPYKEVKR